MIGRSGLPFRKSTTTSIPTRGIYIAPQLDPAQICATLIQHDAVSSCALLRSQGNFTLIRPYVSVVISSPLATTTFAVCGPCMRGQCVISSNWNGIVPGIARIRQTNVSAIAPSVLGTPAASPSVYCAPVTRYSMFCESSAKPDRVILQPVYISRELLTPCNVCDCRVNRCIRTLEIVVPSATTA